MSTPPTPHDDLEMTGVVGFDDDAVLDDLVNDVLGRRPRPINWARLTPEQADEQLRVLDAWVRWLVLRYGLDHREVPECWARHGNLFEELSALHTAHQAAYDTGSSPHAPADWHQVLANTRVRLQAWAARTGCRPTEHRPSTPTNLARIAATDAPATKSHVVADGTCPADSLL